MQDIQQETLNAVSYTHLDVYKRQKEELALRVAELEEELDDTDDAAGQDTSVSPENALTGHENLSLIHI